MSVTTILEPFTDTIKNKLDITVEEFDKVISEFATTILKCDINIDNSEWKKKIEKSNYQYYNVEKKVILVYYRNIDKVMKSINLLQVDMENEQFEWGIVFNREGIYLLNNDITLGNRQHKDNKIVFTLSYHNKTDINYIDFLSMESLTGKYRNTYFFRDMIKYRNEAFKGSEKSWQVYHSMLKRFFKYYTENKNYTETGMGEFNYNEIGLKDFEGYIRDTGRIKTPNTAKNQFFYIKDFIVFMGNNNENFNKSSNVILDMCKDILDSRSQNVNKNEDKMKKILYFFEHNKNVQYKLIFLLLVSFGMERRTICNLKWEDFSENYNYFYVGRDKHKKRKIKVPVILQESLIELKKKEPYTAKYVLGNKRTDYQKPINVAVINDAIGCVAKLDPEDKFYTEMMPSSIRKWLFIYLLDEGVSLQDVLKIMNIPIANIGNFIEDDDLWKYTSRDLSEKHPLEQTLFQKN